MFVLGLTGSIGMGKSTVAAMFARCGVPVHDSDAVVHRLYRPGGAAVAIVRAMFPEAVPDDGPRAGVDRVRLARAAFGDAGALAALEAAIHPLVAADRGAFLRRARRRGARLVVVDVPLLFETGAERAVDAVCVVSAPAFVQEARVLRRPGMTRARLNGVRARQTPDAEKRRRADVVVRTGLSKAATRRRVGALAARLGTTPGSVWPPRRSGRGSAVAPRRRAV